MSDRPTGTPAAVKIVIDAGGWTLENVEPGRIHEIYPSSLDREYLRGFGRDPGPQKLSKWAIGPIEVARILERLGIKVDVKVERSV